MVFANLDFVLEYGAEEKPGCTHTGLRSHRFPWCINCLRDMDANMREMQVEGRRLTKEKQRLDAFNERRMIRG